MRLLHIGDLHFKPKNNYDQDLIIKSLLKSLEGEEPVDLILFSGDLVHSGTVPSHFTQAHQYLFEPLLQRFNLSTDSLIICEGNHDVDRTAIVKAIIKEFESQATVDRPSLENWYDKDINDRKTSLLSSANFNQYLRDIARPKADIIEDLYTVHIREIDNIKVGIVTLNSAWFSSDREDKNQLLFIPRLLEEAIVKIRGCELKVLMQHHPLNYYKEQISFNIQDLVHANFTILLNGHVHKEYVETKYKNNNGIYCNSTKASLCYDEGEIGFSILNVAPTELNRLTVNRFHYIKAEDAFVQLNSVIVELPTEAEKHRQNQIRKKVLSKYNDERLQANQLLLRYDDNNATGFLETFIEPVLSKKSDEQSVITDNVHRVSFSSLKTSPRNFLIFGKDKCGKTSLLKKILLDYLYEYIDNGIVPLYFDYKHLEASTNNLDVTKLLMHEFHLSRADATTILQKGKLILLIDNINTLSTLHAQVIDFLSTNKSIKFIACSEYLTSRIFAEELDHLQYEKVFFKTLGRSEIRSYAKKMPNIKVEDHEVVIERVTSFCQQLQLPINFWTVSLIFLIYKNTNEDYSKNLFSILDSCVDEILQKKKFLFEKTTLKFEQYKTLCSQIAFSLYKNHRTTDYSAPDATIVEIIQNYVNQNLRITPSSIDIFNFLFETGILKKKPDGFYTFRLNGIFEYFLAYYIKENEEFKNEIVSSDTAYLSFKNELEIYSGFNRSDANFLRNIFEKTQKALVPFSTLYNLDLDSMLSEKIDAALAFDSEIKKILVSKALSENQKDSLMDEVFGLEIDSDVHAKETKAWSALDVETVERYLVILSRVYKNQDAITNAQLVNEIFEFLLHSYCCFGFYLIDEYKKIAKEENLSADSNDRFAPDEVFGEQMLQLLSRIVPVLTQAMFYDGIGNLNFSRIIEEQIQILRQESAKNQYKLFMLYFLLMDIDLKHYKNLVEDIFEEITLPPLKVATLFKLKFYLAFKSAEKSPLEQFFKNRVQEAEFRLDEKANIGDLQRDMSKQTKKKMLKK